MADAAATTAGTTTTSTTSAPPFASLLEWVRHLVHHDEDDANSGCTATGRKKRRRTAGGRAFLHPAIDIDATTRKNPPDNQSLLRGGNAELVFELWGRESTDPDYPKPFADRPIHGRIFSVPSL
jgi:hypothetical protein